MQNISASKQTEFRLKNNLNLIQSKTSPENKHINMTMPLSYHSNHKSKNFSTDRTFNLSD
jgi:hypothetical protein